MIIHARTYDPTDCTSIGWDIHIGRTMTRAQYRNRWQGSRNDIHITIHGDLRDVPAGRIADALNDVLYQQYGAFSPRRGDQIRMLGERARVTHAGHIVE